MAEEQLSGFEEFCGGQFWDSNFTWNTATPDFTPCFHKSVLAWTPGLVLTLLAPFEVAKCLRSQNRDTPWALTTVSKLIITLVLVAVAITELVFAVTRETPESVPIDYLTTSLFLVFYLISLFLLLMAIRNGVHTQPAQFFFYLLSVFCGGITLYSIIRQQYEYDPEYYDLPPDTVDRLSVVYGIQFSCYVLLFALNLFPDPVAKVYDPKLEELEQPCPQIQASFASRLYYFWCDSLLWKGYKNPLEPTDLWQMHPDLTSRGVVPQFDRNYEAAIKSAKKKGVKHTVTPSLIKTFGPMFFAGAALKIINDTLAMFSPQIMSLMIEYVESYAAGDTDSTWKGFFYGALLFIVMSLQSVILSQYFERMFIVGMNVRTALISVIYRKSLIMSGASKKESTVGETVNLMAVDIQRLMDLLPYLNMLWSAPFQIGLCCFFIYQELGEAMFAGLALLIVTIPLNGIAASFTRKYQMGQMKLKDERVKVMNEILGGIKVLKLYGWEKSFIEQVLGIRGKEVVVLRKIAWVSAFISFVWTSVPFLVALACFTTYIFIHGGQVLTAQKAFVTLSYLNIMRMPMAVLPFMIIGLVQVRVAIKRMNKYLNNEDLQSNVVDRNEDNIEKDDAINISSGIFRWGREEPVCLENINVAVKKGSLTAIVGTVGSGKSSLISAMLGEMEKDRGKVNVVGRLAYVPQQAWMQNATVRENILFGVPEDEATYNKIVDGCALRSDLDILPGGDQTEIGEKGINLSGGQKQRVSLARAIYSNADLYLLDDPLSAVDSHVGKHIFNNVIYGRNSLLEGKTRVLVTHGLTYLPKTDYIIVMKDGKVSEQGTYQELVEHKGAFAEFLLEYMTEENEDDIEDIKHQLEDVLGKEQFQFELQRQITRRESVMSGSHHELSEADDSRPLGRNRTKSEVSEETSLIQRQTSVLSKQNSVKEEEKTHDLNGKVIADKKSALIEKEVAQTGSVKLSVYTHYMKNVGVLGVVAITISQLFYQIAAVLTNYWLSVWTGENLGPSDEAHWRNVYLGVYGGLGFMQAICTLISAIILSLSTLGASLKMHKRMLNHVLRSPMGFFDTTPLGRIVNRFAKDVDVCDNTLPQNIRSWLSTFFGFLGTVIMIAVLIPFFVVIIVPIAIVFFFIQSIYVNTSRQLKRLESISRSPIYSHFGETVQGASTIRAFDMQKRFIMQSEKLVDDNQECYYPSIMANRWLAVRLEFLGNIVTFCAAVFAIMDPVGIDPSEVGLIITYALSVTQTLNWLGM